MAAPPSWPIAAALGRIEGWRLLGHPAVALALVLTALLASAQRTLEVTDRTEAALDAGFTFSCWQP